MDEPIISIVIVALNAGNVLEKAIKSVLAQTYKNLELVIIDGGSNDNTSQLVEKYASQIGYYISEKDSGVYDAMNKGIAAAKGDWIFFLGADDRFYNNDILSTIFSNAELTEIDLVYGDVEFTSNKERYGGKKTFTRLLERNICHQAIFHHKNVFKKLGVFSKKYPILADFDMNIRIFRDTALQKKYVPLIITYFNNSGLSSSVLDRYFHGDMLMTFLEKDKTPFFAPYLQQFHFYYGLIGLYSKKPGRAFKHIPVSWITGKRKLFYFLFTIKFLLRSLIGDKIVIRPAKQG